MSLLKRIRYITNTPYFRYKIRDKRRQAYRTMPYVELHGSFHRVRLSELTKETKKNMAASRDEVSNSSPPPLSLFIVRDNEKH